VAHPDAPVTHSDIHREIRGELPLDRSLLSTRSMKRALLSVLVSALLVACGGSVNVDSTDGGSDTAVPPSDTGPTSDTTPSLDTAPSFDTGPAIDVGPGACNDLANIGAVIDEVNVPVALPKLSGATSIPSGTYVLTKNEHFTGPGGASGKTGKTLRETLVVTPGVVQAVVSSDGRPDERTTTAYSIVGSMLRTSSICSMGSTSTPVDVMFDVSGTTLRIAISIGGVNVMVTFERS
jgi:hypothetical protein